ncbi:putative HD phosphohydrolase [Dongia mobilis]|uniref:Putative HD phosphohydrolase n=1 Tax=Dongia mobilis TaxID=578943 RepID=A0A4R6WJZ7_9PROT|nr:HD domain-containing protein [Dongia mobilis]TDQ80836.1 putative HD phosphohydrolase [Dongia mobilis]
MDSETVSFIRMEDGTYEEYQFLDRIYQKLNHGLADNLLANLKLLAGDRMGYRIDRYQHSLQSATRAMRDGQDEEMIVCALLHDIGDLLAPENHSQLAASILRPYVSERNYWMIEHHGIFQGYYYFHHLGMDRNERDKYRGHPHFQHTADFCHKYDQNSFDPDYDTAPIEVFEPMVQRLFARPPFGVKRASME